MLYLWLNQKHCCNLKSTSHFQCLFFISTGLKRETVRCFCFVFLVFRRNFIVNARFAYLNTEMKVEKKQRKNSRTNR